MLRRSRWNLVITGLLYPAFLGNLVYLAFEKNLELNPATFLSFAGLLVASLLLHYVLDYVYTVEERPDYGASAFVFDLLIVFFLYLGVKAAIASHELSVTSSQAVPSDIFFKLALWFGFSKLSALAWELHRAWVDSNGFSARLKKISVLALATDGAVAALALIVYWSRDFYWTGFLLLVILGDALIYWWHENKRKAWKDALI